MRPPFPTEKRERNIELVCDFANGMGNPDLKQKYQLGNQQLNHVIRNACRTVNRLGYRELQGGSEMSRVPMKVLRENKHLFKKENN